MEAYYSESLAPRCGTSGTSCWDAARTVSDLLSRPSGSVSWVGSRRCLVELVAAAAEERVLTDGCGGTLSREALGRRVFKAVGWNPPRQLTTTVFRIRNRVMRQPPLELRVKEALKMRY